MLVIDLDYQSELILHYRFPPLPKSRAFLWNLYKPKWHEVKQLSFNLYGTILEHSQTQKTTYQMTHKTPNNTVKAGVIWYIYTPCFVHSSVHSSSIFSVTGYQLKDHFDTSRTSSDQQLSRFSLCVSVNGRQRQSQHTWCLYFIHHDRNA